MNTISYLYFRTLDWAQQNFVSPWLVFVASMVVFGGFCVIFL